MRYLYENMAAPISRAGSSLAAKRARSQDSGRSGRSGTASPVPKAPKTENVPDDAEIPAFLRQTKAGRLGRVIVHTRSCMMQVD